MNIVFLPRVKRALDDAEGGDVVFLYAQLFRGFGSEQGQLLAGFKTEITDKYHRPSLPASLPLAHAHCRL